MNGLQNPRRGVTIDVCVKHFTTKSRPSGRKRWIFRRVFVGWKIVSLSMVGVWKKNTLPEGGGEKLKKMQQTDLSQIYGAL